MLQTIPSSKINVTKWNACVKKHQAPIYCSFQYLTKMATNWVGFVLNDYEAVFAICYRKKMGIMYSYMPAFVQQTGMIGCQQTDFKIFETAILNFVKYGDVMLHPSNNDFSTTISPKTNFVIDLHQTYSFIYENYTSDLKKNLIKAQKSNFLYNSNDNIIEAIDTYKLIYENRIKTITEDDFSNFKQLCLLLQKDGKCIVRSIANCNKQILAIAVLLKDENRLYNIANSTTVLGKKTAANHFLIDSILKEFANTNLIFDFEGSDLPGVKSFYQKFGAVNQPYFHWHFNNLPWWIKWIKK